MLVDRAAVRQIRNLRKRMVEVEARLAGKLDVRAEDPRNNSRRATIKAMGTAVRWLIGSSAAVVMWLLLLWAERTHDDRQERTNDGPGRPATPPRRR
jgi:hypothetical protein